MQTKILIPAILFASITACHNGKLDQTEIKPDQDTTKISTTVDNTGSNDGQVSIGLNYSGVVRDMTKKDGCGWMIEIVSEEGGKTLLEPLSLPAEYQVEGKVIEFAFTNSKRQTKCTVPSRPITIDNIIK